MVRCSLLAAPFPRVAVCFSLAESQTNSGEVMKVSSLRHERSPASIWLWFSGVHTCSAAS
ncbi:unnamed protein product [Cuscuta europaea]|uniref:Uncharacterized protein n=1 Tax=Cuscuta europaea TaxID=41803 RepID=A0A9P0Z9S4_CUSEU|nr:unnamed protein product [Cuscuta europaea]